MSEGLQSGTDEVHTGLEFHWIEVDEALDRGATGGSPSDRPARAVSRKWTRGARLLSL